MAYWLALNVPVLLVALAVGINWRRARFLCRFVRQHGAEVPLALGEQVLVATALLLVTGFLAVAAVGREIEDGSLFFVYEQPWCRAIVYVAMKLLIGGFPRGASAVWFATLFATAAGYTMMLLGGKVT